MNFTHIGHLLQQTLTMKPGDCACCIASCVGCKGRFYSEFMWLAKVKLRLHEMRCDDLKLILVYYIWEEEDKALLAGRQVREYLGWVWPTSYSKEQLRQAKRYCEDRGYPWDWVGANVRTKHARLG